MCPAVLAGPASSYSTGRPSLAPHRDFWLSHFHLPGAVRNWLLEGFRIPFHARPLRSALPNYVRPEDEGFVDEEVARLVKTGAARPCATEPHNVSPLTCAPKKSGKLRLCIDLRFVNAFVQAPYFKLEDLSTLAPLLQPDDLLATADLSEGYHHLLIHPSDQQYLGFRWRGQWYTYTVLPFGLSCAPWAFTKFLRPLVEYLRARGLRVMSYIDDFILAARPDRAAADVALFRETLTQAGLCFREEKCHFDPATEQQFLGYLVSTRGQVQYRIPAEKRRSIRHEIARLLRADRPPVRRVAHVAGLCLSVSRALTPAKLLLRNVYRDVSLAPSWGARIVLSPAARQDLEWWLSGLESWNGACPLPTPADFTLATDASDIGWGASWGAHSAQGNWTPAMRQFPINYRESMAVLNALRIWAPAWSGKTVLVQCDNATTVAHLNGFGRLNPALDAVARAIHSLAARHRISLRAMHIAGTTNTSADALSRELDRSDWMLHPLLFASLDRLWGPHSIDRMASFATRQVPRYESRHRDIDSLRADTLSARWDPAENSWVNPPFSLIHRVLRHIQASRCEATLLAPVWPGQPWFPLLLDMAIDLPVVIPHSPRAFRPAATGHSEPTKNLSWRVCAWRISGLPHPAIGRSRLVNFLRRAL